MGGMDWEGLRCGMSLWIDNVKCVHILLISSFFHSIFQADLKFKIRNSFLIHTLDPHFRCKSVHVLYCYSFSLSENVCFFFTMT